MPRPLAKALTTCSYEPVRVKHFVVETPLASSAMSARPRDLSWYETPFYVIYPCLGYCPFPYRHDEARIHRRIRNRR